jgi:hypothetical protein
MRHSHDGRERDPDMVKTRDIHYHCGAQVHRRVSRASIINRYAQALRDLREAELKNRMLEDVLEDMQLNAIADERSKGPFVTVALDDL